MPRPPHSFHIPVMGTGFTIDTPLRVARYGISSVISLVDDVLLEQVRQYHCRENGVPYEAISDRDEDPRARRVTAYLNLIDRIVSQQVKILQASPFGDGSEISRYFEMLPESDLKEAYHAMLAVPEGPDKRTLQDRLRTVATPGSIDVNIMTKLDCAGQRPGGKSAPEDTDAMAALRGFANSTLHSAIVFSAGINPRLYSYASQFKDFQPDREGRFKKEIILKVSDFRSAAIQAKFLAKRGLWVSEYRIESGLNCGGHAFATTGHLLGPVLEEFKLGKSELVKVLQSIYVNARNELNRPMQQVPSEVRITVQGGIGTAAENDFLLKYYQLSGTGWGTPFLLVPEATNLDQAHIDKMINAQAEDVYLSDSSPLGVSLWNLRTSASEDNRRQGIRDNRPGSPCPKGYIAFSNEFTEKPVCQASAAYIKRRLEHLPEEHLSEERQTGIREKILKKACICHDLGGGVSLKYNLDPTAKPSVCCGPNIINFYRIASIEEMVSHIYGRLSLLRKNDRPHMFVQEIRLYVDQLRRDIKNMTEEMSIRPKGYYATFKANLLSGIEYYRGLAGQFIEEHRDRFLKDLKMLQREIEAASAPVSG